MNLVWLLDCDNTLYPAGTGFFERVNGRIDRFMTERMGFTLSETKKLRARYRASYGVTLAGLMAEHSVDPGVYLPYVHDVELNDLISPDPSLGDALRALPGRKIIFTNGSLAHASRVLARLGVEGEFEAIYDIAYMDYVPKPKPHGYGKLLAELAVPPGVCVMADDMEINLDTAKGMGMVTVKVGGGPSTSHLHAENAKALKSVRLDSIPL